MAVYNVVRIGAKGDMKMLKDFDNPASAQAYVDGYTDAGGLNLRGRSEASPRIEVWTIGKQEENGKKG